MPNWIRNSLHWTPLNTLTLMEIRFKVYCLYSFEAIWPIKLLVNFSIFFTSGMFSALYCMHCKWWKKVIENLIIFLKKKKKTQIAITTYLYIVSHLHKNVSLRVDIFHGIATSHWICQVHIFGGNFKIFPVFNKHHYLQ